jgi:hypothetical protein
MRASEHLEHDVRLPRTSKVGYKSVTKDLLEQHKKESARMHQEQQEREQKYQSNLGKLLTFATTAHVEALEIAKRVGYLEGLLTPEQREAYAERFKNGERLNGNGDGSGNEGIPFKPTTDQEAASEADAEKKDTHGD